MHPVSAEIQIPIEGLEKELLPFARPGFSGTVTVPVHVRQEAALLVEFGPAQVRECQRVNAPQQNVAPEWKAINGEKTERQLTVEGKLFENRTRFRLVSKIKSVVAHFGDGRLHEFDLEWVR